jgi:predicted ATPase
MAVQPFGTVTLVFTDIQGSTRLLHELGQDAYREALAEHRRVVRETFGRRQGYEVDYEGDAFFYAFASPADAVSAVEEVMLGLERGPIRIRVGIHTGEPGLDPPKYVGLDVHLAARVMSVGHGGQVLLTRATHDLLKAELLDLGEHRLKDIQDPVGLYQLGDAPFPPLRTISNTNLPRPASSFVGRQREVDELVSLLRDGARLVTLVGPGGSGKTRLAIEAASELVGVYRAGVFWVGLAPLRDPSLVLDTIRQALGATEQLAGHIGEREMLLLLDNFEQVVDAAPDISSVLRACPNLCLLITSRELLGIDGELPAPVPPLVDAEAVQLFCERSRLSADGRIGDICSRLDNLPLAVELAAARARVLTVEQIAERLGGRLDLFKAGRDADPRQQTLRATIDWSYALLDEPEALLFRRLAVFAGGCTLEAAEAVCTAHLDDLQSLVDKSLVRRTSNRFWMLETIREYALEQLPQSGETEVMRRRHAEYLLSLAGLAGFAHDSTTPERHDLMLPERDNIRAALEWAIAAVPELGIRLIVELEMFWVACSPYEGRRWLGELLERAAGVPEELRALAIKCYGGLIWLCGDFDEGNRYYEQALTLYRRFGDEQGVALVLPRIAMHLTVRGDLAQARSLSEESLAFHRRVGFKKGEAEALLALSYVEREEGMLERALELSEHSCELADEVGWRFWQTGAELAAADCARELDRAEQAASHAWRSLELAHAIGSREWTVYALTQVVLAAAASGQPARAGCLWAAIETEAERGPIGQWDLNRAEHAERLFALTSGPDFERGLARGRALTLDEAVDYALGGQGEALNE